MNVYGPLKVAQLEWFTDAGKPSASGANTYRAIYVTDKKQVQISDGTQWNPMSILSTSVLASRPAASSANQYQTWYTTDDNNLWVSTGSAWTQVTAAPADGSVTANKFDGSTVSWSGEGLNIGIAASVAASAMTIALKTKAGTDATASDYINVAFRNSTAATGTYVVRKITAALSTVISSGSTAGQVSAVAGYVYVYLIDNAGTVELAWSGTKIADEGSLISTTAEGGAGAADSKTTIYSTTARSNVACRLIGRIKSTQATAGTWASAPTEISLLPFEENNFVSEIYLDSPNGHGSTNNKIRRWTNTIINNGGSDLTYTDSSTLGGSITVNTAGKYHITIGGYNESTMGLSVNTSAPTTTINNSLTYAQGYRIGFGMAGGIPYVTSTVLQLNEGDVLRYHGDGAGTNTTFNSFFHVIKLKG